MRDITKIFPSGTVANQDVNFDLKKGEVHALLGENGAGKTTLMKIMSGCLTPTKGTIYVEGKKVEFKSPADALKNGIGMVHQHFTLIPTMTVFENLKLGLIGQKLEKQEFLKDVKRFSEMLGFQINLDAPVYAISVGERQRIEILRLLLRRAKILIFDEPTSLLCGLETVKFLQTIRSLANQGYSIVFISHKIREAMQICDRITIMRRGRIVATLERNDVSDETQLIELMLGERLMREIEEYDVSSREKPLLRVRNLTVKNDQGLTKVQDLSFDVYAGEILGIAGIEGNGQKELVEAIVGLRKPVSGEISFGDNPDDVIKPAYIPANRMELGVAPSMSIAVNSVLRRLEDNLFTSKAGILNFNSINRFAQQVVSFMSVKTPSIKTPVKYLSGGNIQKLIVGREILTISKLLVAEQPTAGLDAKTTYYVRKKLVELKTKNVGIILVSSDLDEILEISDRIAVIRDGKITGLFTRKEADPKSIGSCMLVSEVAPNVSSNTSVNN